MAFKKCVIKDCNNKVWKRIDSPPLCKRHSAALRRQLEVEQLEILNQMEIDWNYFLSFATKEGRPKIEDKLRRAGISF